MKNLNLEEMETIEARGSKFCAGFGAATLVLEIGAWANAWNPVGWGTAGVLLAGNVYCAVRYM